MSFRGTDSSMRIHQPDRSNGGHEKKLARYDEIISCAIIFSITVMSPGQLFVFDA